MSCFDTLDVAWLRSRRGKKWSAYPADVIPAYVADMDFPVAEPIQRVLERQVSLSDYGYLDEHVWRELIDNYVDRCQRRFDWTVHADRVEVITDAVQAMFLALEVYSRPGDSALMLTPLYPPFLDAANEMRRVALCHTLHPSETGYAIDVDAFARLPQKDTRLLFLCNPHNPTGRVFTRAELEAVAEVVLRHDLIVVSDEIHCDLIYDGRSHIPFASLDPEVEARTLTIMSATKSFNIAGLRCALVAAGSDRLHRQFLSIPARLRGGVNGIGVLAARAAWVESQSWLDALLTHLQSNRDYLTDFLSNELPAVRYYPPQATYLAWLDCRELAGGEDPYTFLLEEAKVALSDGRNFGDGGRGRVRLNFATSRGILSDILARMAEAWRR